MPSPAGSNEDNTPPFAVPYAAIQPTRLVPYAKDHDRLQLALLYIEANACKFKEMEPELPLLRAREKKLEDALKSVASLKEKAAEIYLRVHHPAKYINSSGQEAFRHIATTSRSCWSPVFSRPPSPSPNPNDPYHKEQRETRLKVLFELEKDDVNELDAIRVRIQQIGELQAKAKEGVAQKAEILRLIEELYATAFDGVTPEFPHEDELEGLVEIAEAALRGEQAALEGIPTEPGLNELAQLVGVAQEVLNEIKLQVENIVEDFRVQKPAHAAKFFAEEIYKTKLDQLCEHASQHCQTLREELSQYLATHPESTLHGTMGGLVEVVADHVPTLSSQEMIMVVCESSQGGLHVHHTGDYFAVICRKLKYVSGSLTMAIQKVEEKVVAAKKAVRAASIMLNLRHRQLAAARCHILDHVVDPENCPLEQREDRLPRYPEQILIHGLTRHDPRIDSLFEQAERYTPEEYVSDIVRARLNRARRTSHPPILSPARYQPPVYDETGDRHEMQRHCRRVVPPSEGETPEYSEEPDYAENVCTDVGRVRSIVVDQELNPLVRSAREGLVQRASLDTFIQDMLNMLAQSGLPI